MAEIPRSRRWIGSVRRLFSGGRAPAPSLSSAPAAQAVEDGGSDPRIAVLLAEWEAIQRAAQHLSGERLARLAIFVLVSGGLAGPYLEIAGESASALVLARWTLPILGLLVGVGFLALEAGATASARILRRRGLKVETALNALLAGIGRFQTIGLIGEGAFDVTWEGGARGLVALYGLLSAGWLAALIATAGGWLP